MAYSEPNFGELSPNTLEHSKSVIFIVDPEMRITYCNPAWDEFALANDGEDVVAARVIRTDLMGVIPAPLRGPYKEMFKRCRDQHLTFDFDYECSSADAYRLLHMNVLPLNRRGDLAFVNSMRVERNHGPERPPVDPADIYISADGIITMCSHCRRSRRHDASGVWDWVPSFLKTKEWQISHGVCPVCLSYFHSTFYSATGTS